MPANKWDQWKEKLLKRERVTTLLVFLGLAGVALIFLSSLTEGDGEAKAGEKAQETFETAAYCRELEQGLMRIVTAITGESDPSVLVTLQSAPQKVYAADEKTAQSADGDGGDRAERESAHVILEAQGGGQSALTVTQKEPEIKGVVIVSRYADDPIYREKLTEAAKTALGVSSARVCVTGGK